MRLSAKQKRAVLARVAGGTLRRVASGWALIWHGPDRDGLGPVRWRGLVVHHVDPDLTVWFVGDEIVAPRRRDLLARLVAEVADA